MKITLVNPEHLCITGLKDEVFFGGSQQWYEKRWHRMSGCGPVAASNLVWYFTIRQGGNGSYAEIMRDMYASITPGLRGVYTSAMLTDGIMRYCALKSVRFSTEALDIPSKPEHRPAIGAVRDFIAAALEADSPLAFLNLSSGALKNLENWHWVTITALDTDTMQAGISDYGKHIDVDISTWLKTSKLGGAMVYLRVADAALSDG